MTTPPLSISPDPLFTDRTTGRALDYRGWNQRYGINEWFGAAAGEGLDQKIDKQPYHGVRTASQPLPPEMDDLIRLHFLCLNRRVTSVLEFGVGKSTRVFAEALAHNEAEHGAYVREQLRRTDPFRLAAVDNYADWVAQCHRQLPEGLARRVDFTITDVEMTTFNGRICTAYAELPNVCPDLIYLDGPSQFGVKGAVRGISTAREDRLPMAADLLLLEHFLLPGTLIVVDGRTANARFLRANFQRDWTYRAYPDYDIHTFELTEPPLGRWNRRQLAYCLPAPALTAVP